MKVLVFNAGVLGADGETAVAKGVRAALGPRARRPGELCVVFASDAQVRALNKRHLDRDRDTDVIAFPYPKTSGQADAPFGDVYVALGVARRQAKALGHALLKEAVTLAVHGTLHLVGYDDHAPADKRRMFKRQDRLVAGVLGDGKEEARRR
ncbi:MAG: rRNA maturation RNase YbeY [Elusimicrobia bacterium]|nr:rRNA maturation RNase YbeY [Elusimicrobiota bacterium]